MKVSTERILTTHTGSLHRPPDLEETFRRKLAGETYDEEAFRARLRSGVAEIVRKQVDIGIDVIDDGEFSKIDFFSYAKYRLEGVERRAGHTGQRSQNRREQIPPPGDEVRHVVAGVA